MGFSLYTVQVRNKGEGWVKVQRWGGGLRLRAGECSGFEQESVQAESRGSVQVQSRGMFSFRAKGCSEKGGGLRFREGGRVKVQSRAVFRVRAGRCSGSKQDSVQIQSRGCSDSEKGGVQIQSKKVFRIRAGGVFKFIAGGCSDI